MNVATNRVAITGMGVVSALGHSLNETWKNIIEGKPGISLIENSPCEIDKMPIKIAGEVKNFTLPQEYLPEKEWSRYDRFIHYAIKAGHEAFEHAGLKNECPYPTEKMGSILGVGMGGMPVMESNFRNFMEKGARRVSPFFVPGIIPNMAPGLLTLQLGLRGINYSISSACASGAHAISNAAYEIMSGRQDVILSGGSESVLSNLTISGFSNMKALSKNDQPQKASRPFDKDRNGFVIGEGAGILVLENLEKAKARGATIFAEVVGHGTSSDAHHITAPHPEGEGAARCMENALNSAGIGPDKIGYINAHGTSTPLGDAAEVKAIKRTFGKHTEDIYVSSTKSMIGHLLGAAGGIETIFCAMALHEGVLPPTINLDQVDTNCELKHVANKAQKTQIEYALNNSFGFGGTNSSLILKRFS
ncbi:MAG: beta-ketoacyl-ACP synthase II [Bacteriovoracaceae bacterium]